MTYGPQGPIGATGPGVDPLQGSGDPLHCATEDLRFILDGIGIH